MINISNESLSQNPELIKALKRGTKKDGDSKQNNDKSKDKK
ncbi:hypothetical protein [Campylobacter sp. Cr9]